MKKIIKKIDKPLLLLSLLLFIIGLMMIFSSSNVTAYMKYGANPYFYFLKQFLFLLFSIGLSCFLINFHSKTYNLFSRLLMLIIIGFLVFLYLYGSVKNQAVSWIDLGPISLQPSEFAKVIVIMFLASFYTKNKDKLDNIGNILYSLALPIIISILIFLQPDLGTTIIFIGIVAFIFFISPIESSIKKKILSISACSIIVLALVFITSGKDLLASRQLARFDISNPCSQEKFYSVGNQVCNGYIAINNGGLFGVGLGNSTQKYLYLPEAHTDFIFPIIIEELGLVSGIVIMFLYYLLIGRIIKIGRESYSDQGALICYGVAFYIFIHIIVNLGGVFGLLPMTGVPLPFMSYGGSYAMSLVLSLMLVQRVCIENTLYEEKLKKK